MPHRRTQAHRPNRPRNTVHVAILAALGIGTGAALADDASPSSPAPQAISPLPEQAWSLHGQFTNVFQYHPSFPSPYMGANSLDPGNNGKETADVTVFAGARLWGHAGNGAALYANPEIDQGFGLSDTLGVAGFPSGEGYKVGARNPYFRLPRMFVRWVSSDEGAGAGSPLPDGPNQLAGAMPTDNVTLTIGKFSVVDIFDANRYAHDPRADFLNWSVIESGAFDYPADAWGLTYGAAAEWTRSWWTIRGGAFALSKVPNGKDIDGQFRQFGVVGEFEGRGSIDGHAGRLRALAFLNRGRMGRYDDALALALETSAPPSTALVRRYTSRPGLALNAEQEIGADFGVFLRASANDGSREAYDFTEIDRSLAAGASLQGDRWHRADDTVGLAVAVNAISSAARAYFAAGGLGILIGDGRLPDYGLEQIVETYYSARVGEHVSVSADYQFLRNPAYNRDRGPVSVFGLRLHADF
jgi:high affinity Mn2+ porin